MSQLTVASGLVAPCPYYGSMSPYLYSIEIDEHLFLVGPPDQSRIAFSQLAQTGEFYCFAYGASSRAALVFDVARVIAL